MSVAETNAPDDNPDAAYGKRLSVRTNSFGMVIEQFKLPNGKICRRMGFATRNALPSISDELLAMAISEDVGSAPPIPVSTGMDEDDAFGEALKKEIVINEDDPDDVKALKERVKEARKGMLDEMSGGRGFGEVIQEIQAAEKFNKNALDECQNTINEFLKKGDKDGAKEAYDKFSPALSEMGIEGLTLEPDPADLEIDEEQE